MTQFKARKAERRGVFGRIALMGPSGAGKSFTALSIASGLTRNGRVLAIDTERGSLDNYADALPGFSFEKIDLESFSPEMYTEAIEWAAKEGYDTIVTDSLSHAWSGKGGALEMVDNAARRSQSNNTYFAWRDVTPAHNRLVDTMLQVPAHIIVTMRSKMEYVVEDVDGKKTPKKIGLAPVQRADMEYEFSLVGELDLAHNLIVSKTRYNFLDNAIISKPGKDLGIKIREWLDGNEPEGPSKDQLLRQIGAAMKEKKKSLAQLQEAGFSNPRELDEVNLQKLVVWLKEN